MKNKLEAGELYRCSVLNEVRLVVSVFPSGNLKGQLRAAILIVKSDIRSRTGKLYHIPNSRAVNFFASQNEKVESPINP